MSGDETSRNGSNELEDDPLEKDLNMLKNQWDDHQEFLLGVQLFKHLDSGERQIIAQNLLLVQFNDNDMVINQNKNGNHFFIIVEGSALVLQKSTEGEQLMEVSRLGPKEYFGAKGLLLNEAHGASVRANGKITLLQMNEKFFQSNVVPIIRVLKQAAQQYMDFQNLFV